MLIFTATTFGLPVPRDFYPPSLIDNHVENVALLGLPTGAAEGQMLYWDNTAGSWAATDATKLKWTAATSTLLVDTLNLTNPLDISDYTNLAVTSPIILTDDTLSFNLLTSGVDHGGLDATSLTHDDHLHYWADTTIGSRAMDYTTTGTVTLGNLIINLTQTQNQTNGDFTDDFTGWTTAITGTGVWSAASNKAAFGSAGAPGTGTLQSTFASTAGKWYEIVYALSSHSGTGSTIFTFGGNTRVHLSPVTGTFTELYYTFNTNKLKFVTNGPTGGTYNVTIDDVTQTDADGNGIDITSGIAALDITDGVIDGNALTISTTQLVFDTSITGDILPFLNNTYDLGSSSFIFAEGHIESLFINDISDNDSGDSKITITTNSIGLGVGGLSNEVFLFNAFEMNGNRNGLNVIIRSDMALQTLFEADVANDEVIIQGDLYWIGAETGLPYAEAQQADGSTFNVTMTTVNVWVEVNAATTNITAPEKNLVTFPDDHYLLCQKAGHYLVTYSFTAEINSVAGGDQHVESGIMVNDSIQVDKGLGHEQYAATNKERNLQGHTIIDVPTNGQVSLAIKNTTSSGKILTIDHLNITVTQVGGT